MKASVGEWLRRKSVIYTVYILAAVISAALEYFTKKSGNINNNYVIFRSSFHHFFEGVNLYLHYPKEYNDLFLYGPLFSVFIFPFSVVPDYIGCLTWNALNAALFVYAIYQLPFFSQKNKSVMLWICLNSCIICFQNVQFHGITVALIILSYVYIAKGKDAYGTLFTALGIFLKLYGVVGLAFFFFSKNKGRFIAWGIFWSALLFVIPMLIKSPAYVLTCYKDWLDVLVLKNSLNVRLDQILQDISVIGMVRRITQDPTVPTWYFTIPCVALTCFSFLYLLWKGLMSDTRYQLLVLASVLLIINLNSTGTEASTLLIGFTGVAIWYMQADKNPLNLGIFILALALTSFGPTDLMPGYIRWNFLRKYSLMIFPLLIVWLKVNYEIVMNPKIKKE